jgi:D-3-phosphoglycerate dehydrogenase / 2-oxoglutarate reductase
MSYRVVVSDSKVIDLDAGKSALANLDATVEVTDARTPDALLDVAAGADALIVDSRTQVTDRVLVGLDSLRVIGRSGIGVDNIAVQTACEQGIQVVNVPNYCLDEVSTHALGMILSCTRKLPVLDRSVKNGQWDWTVADPIYRIRNQTVGLVGFGKIARRLTEKLQGFDVDILTYDPYVSRTFLENFDVTRVEFDRLLAESDFVSVHAPLTEETEGMFDATAFRTMRNHAIFVNTARGPIVDENALHEALAADEIAGAGLDVRDPEPPIDSRFSEFENVILTPHVGFYSEESKRELSRTVSDDVVRVLRDEPPKNPVDPNVEWF